MKEKSVGIPSIDLSRLRSGEGMEELRRACTEWGFFKLTGHEISRESREDLLNEMKLFFDLPTEGWFEFGASVSKVKSRGDVFTKLFTI